MFFIQLTFSKFICIFFTFLMRVFFSPIDHFDPVGSQYSGGACRGHECSYFSHRQHDPEPVRLIEMVFNLLNSTRHLLGLSNSIGKQISLQRQMKVGFEPRISGFSNDRSANCATSTAFSSNHCSSPKKSLMLGAAVAFHNIYIKQFFLFLVHLIISLFFAETDSFKNVVSTFFAAEKKLMRRQNFFFFLSRQREK